MLFVQYLISPDLSNSESFKATHEHIHRPQTHTSFPLLLGNNDKSKNGKEFQQDRIVNLI